MREFDRSIKNLERFLSVTQDKDMHLWKDFKTRHHGESEDWVTAVVADSLFNVVSEPYALSNIAEVLIQRQSFTERGGGWGYNAKMIPDADSTAWALKVISRFEDYYGYAIEEAETFLLSHQHKEGGFAKYIPELLLPYMTEKYRIRSEDISFEGWCSPNPEITAVAIQVLGDIPEAVEYLVREQQKDGSFRSYWWNNDIYATSQAVLALHGKGCDAEVEHAKRWLAKQKTDIPLYQAYILQALVTERGFDPEIQTLADKVGMYKPDTDRPFQVLRSPYPSDAEPWKNRIESWKDDLADNNRIFTAANCMKALCDHEKRE